MNQIFETEIGGRKLTIELGKLAQQANGSVVVSYGETVVLATVVKSKEPREGIDFFPLLVDYEERLYAAGKIKGSRFIKREGRPSDEAVLTNRLVDRSIRPLFDDRFKNDIQIILTVLSADGENDPDLVSLIAASSVLSISNINWQGPIGGIRVGAIPSTEGPKKYEWVINPTYAAREKGILDLVLAGTQDKIIMIEAGGNEVPEEIVLEAIRFGQKHLKTTIDLIDKIQNLGGKKQESMINPVRNSISNEINETEAMDKDKEEIQEKVEKFLKEKLSFYLFGAKKETKISRKQAVEKLKDELDQFLIEDQISKEKRKEAIKLVDKYVEQEVTKAILEEEKRVDGRSLKEIRPLDIEAGVLPRTHGSALFSRGETQVLSIVTLGAPGYEQIIESIEGNGKKRYMHHYNFPPFSVGEVSPLRFTGRREIGHGALAEKALVPLLPDKESFPYTIRVVSEVLSSNGSSSMASVCGSSLALMDAGVPIKEPVAGIAMGLASDKNGHYKILTDLQDLEDGKGGMDFKIAGTKNGITVIQMDTKTDGLTLEIIEQTFKQAKEARLAILESMNKVIAVPRAQLSPWAPKILTLRINPEKIREVIGPGGKVINEIIDKTGVEIDIEDDGLIFITSINEESAQKALEWIKNLTREVRVGEIFQGRVTRILDFGAFVEILPRQEGLVHVSELASHRVRAVRDIVQIGDIIPVKVIGIDEQGRINLSLRQAQ